MVKFVTKSTNQPLDEYLNDSFGRLLDIIKNFDTAPTIKKTIGDHFEKRYPGSSHWSPSKVKIHGRDNVIVDVPGISRAYHDVTIKAINYPYLKFTIHGQWVQVKEVFQPKDDTLMPTNEEISNAVYSAIIDKIQGPSAASWLK